MRPSLPRIALLASAASLFGLAPVATRAMGGKTRVDAELVLAVDISYSMNPKEQRFQRQGYVAALTSPEFLSALKSGPTGRIALEYIQWSSYDDQNTVLDWTVIDGPQSAKATAARLAAAPYRRASRTSISGGIDASMRDLESDGFSSPRAIIDVSGDGPNNDGRPVTDARADALAKGVTINGLPLVGIRAYVGPADIPNLDQYYQHCVVGGPDSFMIPVHNIADFVNATRTKLVREIAWRDHRATLVPAADDEEQPVSCMIGENLWRRRWGD